MCCFDCNLSLQSVRPAAMLVERSKDFGQTWKIFRFFAEDCALHFPSVLSRPAASIDDIICDSRFSGPEPSTGGEVLQFINRYIQAHLIPFIVTTFLTSSK